MYTTLNRCTTKFVLQSTWIDRLTRGYVSHNCNLKVTRLTKGMVIIKIFLKGKSFLVSQMYIGDVSQIQIATYLLQWLNATTIYISEHLTICIFCVYCVSMVVQKRYMSHAFITWGLCHFSITDFWLIYVSRGNKRRLDTIYLYWFASLLSKWCSS